MKPDVDVRKFGYVDDYFDDDDDYDDDFDEVEDETSEDERIEVIITSLSMHTSTLYILCVRCVFFVMRCFE